MDSKTLDDIGSGVALVVFGAPWCAHCATQEPLVAWVEARYVGRVVVGRVNVDREPALAEAYAVRSLPTLVIVREGVAWMRFEGLQTVRTLSAALDAALRAGGLCMSCGRAPREREAQE